MRRLLTSELKAVALFAVTVVLILLFASPDSYLRDLFNRVDSACFYMCGKAWFSGMTPYVDFTDSKGPVLWFIYGVAHLLSPRDYTGVYWLSCISFTITLWLIYRSARLLLPTRRQAVLVALLMPIAYFYPYIHEEVKTEHFAQPLIALCLYGTLLLQFGRDLRRVTPPRVMAAIGVAVGCVLLMKYSFVPMLLIFALYSLIASRQWGCGVWRSALYFTVGLVAAVVPWLLVLLAQGCMQAFVQQYFINTIATIGQLHQPGSLVYMIIDRLLLLHVPFTTLFPLLTGAGALLFIYVMRDAHTTPGGKRVAVFNASFPLVATLWFFAAALPNAWWIYYYEICTWTYFFGFAALIAWLGRRHWMPSRASLIVVAMAVVAAVSTWSVCLAPINFFTNQHPARNTYYSYVYLMSQVERPTVAYWDIYSCGYETAVDGLPGTLYWTGQNGATPKMRAHQEDAICRGDIDFVFVADTLHDARLIEWGYHKWDYSHRSDIEGCDDLIYALYTRHTLQAPPADFTVPTPAEIVTKRWKYLERKTKK